MYKVKYDICPTNISDLFVKSQSKYNLRIKEFEIPRFNTINYGKNSVRYIAPVLWAKLLEYLDIIRKDCYCSFCK